MSIQHIKEAAGYCGKLFKETGISIRLEARFKGIMVKGRKGRDFGSPAAEKLVEWHEIDGSSANIVLFACQDIDAELQKA